MEEVGVVIAPENRVHPFDALGGEHLPGAALVADSGAPRRGHLATIGAAILHKGLAISAAE